MSRSQKQSVILSIGYVFAIAVTVLLWLEPNSHEESRRHLCQTKWASFENRLIITKGGGSTFYVCQVKIDNTWYPEDAVKITQ